jgi:hypothetical protein
MRAVGLVLAAAVGAVALLFPAGAGSVSAKPRLAIVDLTPMTVQGLGFEPREPIKLTLVDGEQLRVKRFRTGPRGGFLARFTDVEIVDRCSAWVLVTAVSASGVRAYAKAPPLACPPRLRPPAP